MHMSAYSKGQLALLSTPLGSLGLSATAVSKLTRAFYSTKWEDRKRDFSLQLPQYTVGDLIDLWKRLGVPQRNDGNKANRFSQPVWEVMNRLVAAGFTRFDLFELPQSTMSMTVLKSKSAEEWRSLPVALLGTILPGGVHDLARMRAEGRDDRPTVDDLLALPMDSDEHFGPSVWRLWSHRDISMRNTQTLLYELGFRYEDGAFMQCDTDRWHASRMMKRHKLSLRTAQIVVRVARKSGWSLRQI